MMASQELFRAEGLWKSWGGRPIVRSLDLLLHQGEVFGLLGPNGAGKSTAFYMTIGLVRPDHGRCWWRGQEITEATIDVRARLGMGYLAQEPSVFRQLSVQENLEIVVETLRLAPQEGRRRVERSMEELTLSTLAQQKAGTLSGGQRRRLEIARALILEPQLLLLDEPFANVDPLTIEEVKGLIRYLSGRGIAVLITDHNARDVFSIVHRATLLVDGISLATGTPAELSQHPEARSRYLGEHFHLEPVARG